MNSPPTCGNHHWDVKTRGNKLSIHQDKADANLRFHGPLDESWAVKRSAPLDLTPQTLLLRCISGACLPGLLFPSFFELGTLSFAPARRTTIQVSVDHSELFPHGLPHSVFKQAGRASQKQSVRLAEGGVTEAVLSREASWGQLPGHAALTGSASTVPAWPLCDLHHHQNLGSHSPLFLPTQVFHRH